MVGSKSEPQDRWGSGRILALRLSISFLQRDRQLAFYKRIGEGGIRTLGALLGHGALAKRCFQPLSHLTKFRSHSPCGQLLDAPQRVASGASENIAKIC
jgi:hypothetical protein